MSSSPSSSPPPSPLLEAAQSAFGSMFHPFTWIEHENALVAPLHSAIRTAAHANAHGKDLVIFMKYPEIISKSDYDRLVNCYSHCEIELLINPESGKDFVPEAKGPIDAWNKMVGMSQDELKARLR